MRSSRLAPSSASIARGTRWSAATSGARELQAGLQGRALRIAEEFTAEYFVGDHLAQRLLNRFLTHRGCPPDPCESKRQAVVGLAP